MGIWIELGIFFLVLLFAFWQIHDVNVDQRKRQTQAKGSKQTNDGINDEKSRPPSETRHISGHIDAGKR